MKTVPVAMAVLAIALVAPAALAQRGRPQRLGSNQPKYRPPAPRTAPAPAPVVARQAGLARLDLQPLSLKPMALSPLSLTPLNLVPLNVSSPGAVGGRAGVNQPADGGAATPVLGEGAAISSIIPSENLSSILAPPTGSSIPAGVFEMRGAPKFNLEPRSVPEESLPFGERIQLRQNPQPADQPNPAQPKGN